MHDYQYLEQNTCIKFITFVIPDIIDMEAMNVNIKSLVQDPNGFLLLFTGF